MGDKSQAREEEWRWSGIGRAVSISDVHGAFDAMTATLAAAGVLDEELRWVGGKTHLVVIGDVLDRGPDSRKAMDLIMRLEEEALGAGGRVHLLLGNHEVMNLVGDLRYVAKEEFAAFAADELPADRERWFGLSRAGLEGDEASLRGVYDEKYPAGFFGLRRALGSKGAYGPWLMSKPLLVVINDTAYVHGGMSRLVTELGLEGVNRELKSQVTEYVTQTEVLAEAGLLDPTVNFYDHAGILEALPEDASRPAHIQAAIETVLKLNRGSIYEPDSPLWYRGSVACSALIEEDKLATALEAIDADRVVIGHTPTVTRRVLQRMDGRVIEIDTGMLAAAYGGSGNALVIEGETMSVVGENASAEYRPVAHPRRVGFRSDELSAERIAEVLSSGEVTPTSAPDSGTTIVNVTHDGVSIAAVFRTTGQRRNFYPDIAAYRLDRMIGLDMVPVTVAREIDGRQGSLQFIPGSMIDDAERSAQGQGGSAWCPLPEQWQAMYVFDALIYNQGRQQTNMHYSIENWQLILSGHGQTFATNRGLPAYVENMLVTTGSELVLGTGWQKALMSLSDDYLTEQLGDALDKRRIRALARRRDDLLNR